MVQENLRLLKRLQDKKPTYTVEQWSKDRIHIEKVLDLRSKFSRTEKQAELSMNRSQSECKQPKKLSKKLIKYLQAERNSRFVDEFELQRLKEKALSSRRQNDVDYINGFPLYSKDDFIGTQSSRRTGKMNKVYGSSNAHNFEKNIIKSETVDNQGMASASGSKSFSFKKNYTSKMHDSIDQQSFTFAEPMKSIQEDRNEIILRQLFGEQRSLTRKGAGFRSQPKLHNLRSTQSVTNLQKAQRNNYTS